jgi:long-chain acyl-CoA synthetase
VRVEQLLEAAASSRPEHCALVCGGQRLSYAALHKSVLSVAAGLRRSGIGRGDRVVVQLDNSIETVLAIFGALSAGAVFVVVSPTTKPNKLAYILDDCRAAALVADGRTYAALAEAGANLPHVRTAVVVGSTAAAIGALGLPIPFASLLTDTDDQASQAAGIDLDLAALIYTSGSTGIPKGVMLTHLNIVSATTSINGYLHNTSDDVILDVLPLSFDYGLYQLFIAAQAAATLVLERSFSYASIMLERLVQERVTGLPVVPTLATLLLRHDLAAYDLSRLRYITNTGAALPAAHSRQLRTQLPWVRLFSMYGLTECKRVSYLPPEEIDAHPDSVGYPMPNVEAFVADESGHCSSTGTGELVIRGSNVMLGYWGQPEETARVLRPGALPGEQYLFTGDVFRIDDAGRMYFVSRTDDIIKSRGEKVSPKEVENILYEIPGVLATAVIGVPDPVLGASLRAYVVLDAGISLTESEVLRHCAQRLEDVMVPKSVEFVADLPRTSSGKIARRAISNQRSAEL